MFSYEKFETLCKERSVSVYRVAQSTSIATPTFTEWKNGTYTPKAEKIMKIAQFFNVPITYFIKEGA